jgi:LytR cell envelope-related transcriptional attenuator
MNRVPARPNKRTAADLEKRVSILTWLVVAQLVLLLVLFGFELFDDNDSASTIGDNADNSTEMMDDDSASEAEMNADLGDASDVDQDGEMPPEAIPTRPVRVEILNGCGVSGLAGQYARSLRDQGYDVRDTRNAPHHNYEKSWIIDRSAIPGIGHRLAATLGIDSAHVTFESNPQLVDVDLSLILGKDHQSLNIQPTP